MDHQRKTTVNKENNKLRKREFRANMSEEKSSQHQRKRYERLSAETIGRNEKCRNPVTE